MHIAILTFQGFNELDSLIALGVLNRIKRLGWRVTLCCPESEVTSMNGVTVRAQSLLEDARSAEAVIVGSGIQARAIANTPALLARLSLDPSRQLIAAQCSGTLLLAKLGLLGDVPACTDLTTKPWVQEAGVQVLNQPFFAQGNIATAGGCLASPYLAAWIIARSEGLEAATSALHYVAPVGEKEAFVQNALQHISRYLPAVTPKLGFSSSQAALLVIDVQQGAFNGELIAPIDRGDSLIENTVSLLEAARGSGTPVFFIQHTEGPGELFTKGTSHWELHQALRPQAGEVIVRKTESSAFAGTTLASELEAAKARNLILCGLQSEFCVSNTAKSALSGGYSVVVAEDAHRTWPSKEQAAVAISEGVNLDLRSRGALLSSTSALIGSLRAAGT